MGESGRLALVIDHESAFRYCSPDGLQQGQDEISSRWCRQRLRWGRSPPRIEWRSTRLLETVPTLSQRAPALRLVRVRMALSEVMKDHTPMDT